MSSSIYTTLELPTAVARRYIAAYNAVDLDGLRVLLHPEKFQFSHHNWSVYSGSADEFVTMVGQMAEDVFPGRRFTRIHAVHAIDDLVLLDTRWKGTPITTIADTFEAGVEFTLEIKSLIVVEGGLITEIRDHG